MASNIINDLKRLNISIDSVEYDITLLTPVNLDELKSATAISLSSTTLSNVKNGQYYEEIPVAVSLGTNWTKVSQTKTKYYQWIDAKGNIQYTSLMIKVE